MEVYFTVVDHDHGPVWGAVARYRKDHFIEARGADPLTAMTRLAETLASKLKEERERAH